MTKLASYSLFTILSLVSAVSAHGGHHHHRRNAPGTWYHARDHPSHSLFKRAVGADGVDYPEVGSPTWLAKYPSTTPVAAQMPQEWKAALDAAVKAGKIPDIPKTTVEITADGNKVPHYPAGIDALKPEICSSTQKCLNTAAIWDGPAGTYGTSFDDGPINEHTPTLLNYLKSQNERATHFLIGITMVQNIDALKLTIASGNDLAVHTYTHPLLTSLSNEDIVAELGWTMQIIHDSTGGKVPKYYRPPLGDGDNRVFAVAQEVFGLKAIIWNHDTNDWGLPTGATSKQTFNQTYQSWVSGPKTPGLIILEHETSAESVQGFIDAFPAVKAAGWKTGSLASLVETQKPYQNVDGTKVTPAGILKSGASTGNTGNTGNSKSSPGSLPSGTNTASGATKTDAADASTPSGNGASPIVGQAGWISAIVFLGSLLSLA